MPTLIDNFIPASTKLNTHNIEARYPLLAMEKGLLFYALSDDNSSFYVSQGEYLLDNINPQLFWKAWQYIIQHYEILRSCFIENEAGAIQHIVHSKIASAIQMVNFDTLSMTEAENAYQKILQQEIQTPFDLTTPPLMRLVLCQMPQQKYRFIWTYHHLLLDLRSTFHILDDVMHYYEATYHHQVIALKPAVTKNDILVQLPHVETAQAKTYWQDRLKNYVSSNELPFIGLKNQTPRTTAPLEYTFSIEKSLYSALKQFAHKHRLTPSLIIHTAWGLTLCSYLNRDDILFGTIRSLPYALIKNTAGLFINNLPMRIHFDSETSVLDCLNDAREQHRQLKLYWNTGLGDIQSWIGLSFKQNLFNTCISFSTQEANALIQRHLGDQFKQLEFKFRSYTHYALMLEFFIQENSLLGRFTAQSGLFSQQMIEHISNQLSTVLQQIIGNPQQKICKLSWLSVKDNQQLNDWNKTAAPVPKRTLTSLLEEQIHRTPKQIAAQFENKQLTYFELNAQANQLAHWLQQEGAKPNIPIAVYMDRCIELPIALLAIIKAGGVYLPLDVKIPTNRLDGILKDSQVYLILTTSEWQSKLNKIINYPACSNFKIFSLDKKDPLKNYPKTNLTNINQPNDDVYIIYTSGSTGKPKGVINHHQGLVNRLNWMKNILSLQTTDRILQKTSISFDVSIWEFFLPWLVGARTVFASSDTHYDFDHLVEIINTQQITILHFVPTILSAFLQHHNANTCQSLRYIISSGEILNTKTVNQCLEVWPNAKLYNLYGPTEASIDVSYHLCRKNSNHPKAPIGKPIDNTQLFVLNHYQQPVPIGGIGELHIGGMGVAKGYLNQSELTAKCFIKNPLSSLIDTTLSKILYKTGDLVTLSLKNVLHFIGRADNQVKWHGFRIELDEIKIQLLKHPDIIECALSIQEVNHKPHIIAYYVTKNLFLTSEHLQQILSKELPYYMVPHYFLRLDYLPLLVNGKLDQKSLPLPILHTQTKQTVDTKVDTDIKTILLEIWKEVLQVDDININDNLFALGGDSITVIQIAHKAHRRALPIKPKWIFENPTINKLSLYIKDATSEETPIVVTPTKKIVYLTPIQNWFFEKSEPYINNWHQYVLLTIDKSSEIKILYKALDTVLLSHDVFRLRFKRDSNGNWKSFYTNTAKYTLESIYPSQFSTKKTEKEIIKEIQHKQANLINITEGPLIRICLIEWGDNKNKQLLFIIHHLIVDAISWHILIENITHAYKELLFKKNIEKRNIEITTWRIWTQYLAQHVESKACDNSLLFWTKENFNTKPLPLDYTKEKSALVKTENSITYILENSIVEKLLKTLPEFLKIPTELLLIYALAKTLTDWQKEKEILLDIEHHGRSNELRKLDTSNTIGWFTNIFPLPIQINIQKNTFDNLIELNEKWQTIKPHRLNYGLLYYSAKKKSGWNNFQLKQLVKNSKKSEILFNYLGSLDSLFNENNLFKIEEEDSFGQLRDNNIAQPYIFEIHVFIINKKLHIRWLYNSVLHKHETVHNLLKDFEKSLTQIISLEKDFKKSAIPNEILSEYSQLPFITKSYGVNKSYPLSPTQRGILFHSMAQDSKLSYITQLVLTLSGNLKTDIFREVWEEIIMNVDLFKTAFFVKKNGESIQIVFNKVPLPIQFIDLRHEKIPVRTKKLDHYIKQDRLTPFIMDTPPLFRLSLIVLDEHRHIFIYTCHHIISDGWSINLLFKHVINRYYEKITLAQAKANYLYLPYSDYIHHLSHQSIKNVRTYWKKLLSKFDSPVRIDIDKDIFHDKSTKPLKFLRKKLYLGNDLSQKIKKISREHKITLNIFIQSIWTILLSQYSHKQKIIFGTVISGRSIELEHIENRYGLYSKVIPTFVDLKKFNTIIPLCHFLFKQLIASENNSNYPLASIQADIYDGQPLFNYIIAFENYPIEAALNEVSIGFKIDNIITYETTHYPLNVFFFPGDAIEAEFVYDTRYFNNLEIRQFSLHFKNLLQSLVTNINQPIHHLSVLNKKEQKKILTFSNHFVEIQSNRETLNQLIEASANKYPQKVAVRYNEITISYIQLIESIDLFSSCLYAYGARSGHVIALLFKHHPDALIAMLACLKLGCTYLPLSADSSLEYLAYLLKDSQTQLILTNRYTNSIAYTTESIADKKIILTDDFYHTKAKKINPSLSTEHTTAYLMYTSGSTGKPKGVAINQDSIIALLNSINEYFKFSENDAFIAFSAYIFDISVVELYLPLIMGGECIILPFDETRIHNLLNNIQTPAKHTFVQTTPSVWSHLLNSDFLKHSSIKIISTGEALPTSLVNSFIQQKKIIWNCYGPTETTIFATASTIHNPKDLHKYVIASIGKPLVTTRTYVLNECLALTPIGVAGELYIGGTGVMQGYIGEAGTLLNQQKLIPNPFKKNELLYKTGDKVCWLPDGNLQFFGRFDDQVKIRGFRVDLNQITSILEAHPWVKKAIVLKQDKQSHDAALITYLLLEDKNVLYDSISIAQTHCEQWEVIYERLYQQSNTCTIFDTTGWISSYTGKPLAKADMQEWVENTVKRIVALEPQKILEIGCGMGLLLFCIAPLSQTYHGIDISHAALTHITEQLANKPFKNKVALSQGSANTFHVPSDTLYDTIIINSVVQYFPHIYYLIDVLDRCTHLVSSGGQIFIGDVRSFTHLKHFHANTVSHRASSNASLEELKHRYFKYLHQEKELVIDPLFFIDYAKQHTRISHVSIQLKTGKCKNEMNDYRYDVVLHIEKPITETIEVKRIDWQQEQLTLTKLPQCLSQQTPIIYLANIPHDRWTKDNQLISSFEGHAENLTLDKHTVSPFDLKSVTTENYEIFCLFSAQKNPTHFDAVLRLKSFPIPHYLGQTIHHHNITTTTINWQNYANKPWQVSCYKKIYDNLHQHLLDKLPHYMVPSAFIVIDDIPVTPNGKLDRKALTHYEPIVTTEYQAANTDIEKALIYIWQDILGIREIGIKDNFFQLGGHSLNALQVIHAITERWHIALDVIRLFETPTVFELAQEIQERLSQTHTGKEHLSSSLVILKKTGKKPPLFFIHPVGGTVFCYIPLTESLSIDHPIIGIQDPGITTPDILFNSLSEMAAHYMQLIKTKQSSGPYYLAGASLGGTLAVEIAHQLTEQGDTVNFIGLFDTWAAFTEAFNSRARLEKTLWRQYGFLKERLTQYEIANPEPWLDLNYQRLQLLLQYQHHKIKQPIYLFKAQDIEPEYQDLNEASNHWSLYTTQPMNIYAVPGNHESILVEPNVQVLAKLLTKCLEKIDNF